MSILHQVYNITNGQEKLEYQSENPHEAENVAQSLQQTNQDNRYEIRTFDDTYQTKLDIPAHEVHNEMDPTESHEEITQKDDGDIHEENIKQSGGLSHCPRCNYFLQ